MNNKTFKSIDNNHIIHISYIDDVALFNIDKFDAEHYKTFFLLVRNVMDYMYSTNIKYIKQYITIEDSVLFPPNECVHIDDHVIVTTHIDHFINNLCNALGVQLI